MKKLFFLLLLVIALALVSILLPSDSSGEAAPAFKQGEISGIDPETLSYVVEVPMGSRLYTVGGKLSVDAVLKKGKTKGLPKDFKVGDIVKIGWGKNRRGHIIKYLELTDAPSWSITHKNKLLSHNDIMQGALKTHVIRNKETLLDIARDYDLGFNEIQDLYPDLDPWIPPVGKELVIPSQRLLPASQGDGIVINIAEFRLYYYRKGVEEVLSFPVGLGDQEWTTPVGKYNIGEKRKDPKWFIPASLQYKYQEKIMPAGPDNPLGEYWMGLEGTSYGIHGTDIPWSVGRLVTHGCIRLYPEDIKKLYNIVKPGTIVTIIYEPVKIGFISGRVYVEVHRDIYGRFGDLTDYGYLCLHKKGLFERVDHIKFKKALELQDGLPKDVTLSEGGSKPFQQQPHACTLHPVSSFSAFSQLPCRTIRFQK